MKKKRAKLDIEERENNLGIIFFKKKKKLKKKNLFQYW